MEKAIQTADGVDSFDSKSIDAPLADAILMVPAVVAKLERGSDRARLKIEIPAAINQLRDARKEYANDPRALKQKTDALVQQSVRFLQFDAALPIRQLLYRYRGMVRNFQVGKNGADAGSDTTDALADHEAEKVPGSDLHSLFQSLGIDDSETQRALIIDAVRTHIADFAEGFLKELLKRDDVLRYSRRIHHAHVRLLIQFCEKYADALADVVMKNPLRPDALRQAWEQVPVPDVQAPGKGMKEEIMNEIRDAFRQTVIRSFSGIVSSLMTSEDWEVFLDNPPKKPRSTNEDHVVTVLIPNRVFGMDHECSKEEENILRELLNRDAAVLAADALSIVNIRCNGGFPARDKQWISTELERIRKEKIENRAKDPERKTEEKSEIVKSENRVQEAASSEHVSVSQPASEAKDDVPPGPLSDDVLFDEIAKRLIAVRSMTPTFSARDFIEENVKAYTEEGEIRVRMVAQTLLERDILDQMLPDLLYLRNEDALREAVDHCIGAIETYVYLGKGVPEEAELRRCIRRRGTRAMSGEKHGFLNSFFEERLSQFKNPRKAAPVAPRPVEIIRPELEKEEIALIRQLVKERCTRGYASSPVREGIWREVNTRRQPRKIASISKDNVYSVINTELQRMNAGRMVPRSDVELLPPPPEKTPSTSLPVPVQDEVPAAPAAVVLPAPVVDEGNPVLEEPQAPILEVAKDPSVGDHELQSLVDDILHDLQHQQSSADAAIPLVDIHTPFDSRTSSLVWKALLELGEQALTASDPPLEAAVPSFAEAPSLSHVPAGIEPVTPAQYLSPTVAYTSFALSNPAVESTFDAQSTVTVSRDAVPVQTFFSGQGFDHVAFSMPQVAPVVPVQELPQSPVVPEDPISTELMRWRQSEILSVLTKLDAVEKLFTEIDLLCDSVEQISGEYPGLSQAINTCSDGLRQGNLRQIISTAVRALRSKDKATLADLIVPAEVCLTLLDSHDGLTERLREMENKVSQLKLCLQQTENQISRKLRELPGSGAYHGLDLRLILSQEILLRLEQIQQPRTMVEDILMTLAQVESAIGEMRYEHASECPDVADTREYSVEQYRSQLRAIALSSQPVDPDPAEPSADSSDSNGHIQKIAPLTSSVTVRFSPQRNRHVDVPLSDLQARLIAIVGYSWNSGEPTEIGEKVTVGTSRNKAKGESLHGIRHYWKEIYQDPVPSDQDIAAALDPLSHLFKNGTEQEAVPAKDRNASSLLLKAKILHHKDHEWRYFANDHTFTAIAKSFPIELQEQVSRRIQGIKKERSEAFNAGRNAYKALMTWVFEQPGGPEAVKKLPVDQLRLQARTTYERFFAADRALQESAKVLRNFDKKIEAYAAKQAQPVAVGEDGAE